MPRYGGCYFRRAACTYLNREDALTHVEQRLPTPPAVNEEELPPALEVPAEEEDLPPARPPTPEGYWQRGTQEEVESADGDAGRRTPLCDRVLGKLKSRPHRLGDERAWRLTLMRKRTQRAKARRLAVALAQERADENSVEASASVADFLGNIRPKEVQAYQVALRRFGRRADRRIDQADLLDALSELGFRPRNKQERAAFRELLFGVSSLEVDADYVVQCLVPQARVQLAELRRPLLINLFQEADEDKRGELSVAELLAVLERSGFYPTLNEVVEAVVEVIPGASTLTNMEGKMLLDRISVSLAHFRILAPLLQERAEYSRRARAQLISEELDLDERKRQLWQDGLVDFREAFDKRRVEQYYIQIASLPLVLLDIEMMPKKGPTQALLQSLAQEELSKAEPNEQRAKDRLTFRQCARVLTHIREKECDRVVAIFRASDADGTNGLSVQEARKCLSACGIVAQHEKEENEISELMDEFDIDESGELELDEFLALVKFVTSRLRQRRLREQADVALKYGWQAEEFEAIRESFMAACQQMDGRLREAEALGFANVPCCAKEDLIS
ncbi:unnamed protein product [Symbiodinium natans]|uniref:Calmodulin n=1 Tax=Symbiodinium natans TaxID=878477 RepID=A0A812I8T4_9DINO|nr:unnamed protein product [Symbiodinium natans]